MIHIQYVMDRVQAEQDMFDALGHLHRKGEWFKIGNLDINEYIGGAG